MSRIALGVISVPPSPPLSSTEPAVYGSASTGILPVQSLTAVLSFRSACETANLSSSTLRRLVKAGRGPRLLKLSDRRIGVRRADLDEWLTSRLR